MKRINIKISLIIIFSVLAFLEANAQLTSSNPEVAKWKLEDDQKSHWEFKGDGKMYSSYIGSDVIDVYRYTISSTPPICQEGVTLKVEQHIDFLQLIDEEDGDVSCFYIYALNDERFTALDALSGDVFAFIKAED